LLQDATLATSAIAAVISVGGLTVTGIAVWWSARTLSGARRMITEVAQEVNMRPLRTQAEKPRSRRLSNEMLVSPAQPCQDAE
jgi:hypothetical protein